MSLGKTLLTLVAGTTFALGALGMTAVAAQAAPVPAATHVSPMDSCPCNPPPGGGWRYIDNYFWASSCIDTGNGGINAGLWGQFQCTGGSAFSNYELWVR